MSADETLLESLTNIIISYRNITSALYNGFFSLVNDLFLSVYLRSSPLAELYRLAGVC